MWDDVSILLADGHPAEALLTLILSHHDVVPIIHTERSEGIMLRSLFQKPWSTGQKKLDIKLREEVESCRRCVPASIVILLYRMSRCAVFRTEKKSNPWWACSCSWYKNRLNCSTNKGWSIHTTHLARASGSLILIKLTTMRGPAFSRLLSSHTCGFAIFHHCPKHQHHHQHQREDLSP